MLQFFTTIFADSGLNVTGNLENLANSPNGFPILCLTVLCVILIIIFLGVGWGIKEGLGLLKQTLEGYNKLTLSIDNLADSQTELANWLKVETSELKRRLDIHAEKINQLTTEIHEDEQ